MCTNPKISGPGRAIVSDPPETHPNLKRLSYPHKKGLSRVSKREGADTERQERSDSYVGSLFGVPGRPSWRVVVSNDGLQWILQQREARDHWEGRKYFHSKGRLAVVVGEMFGAETLAACRDRINSLPL